MGLSLYQYKTVAISNVSMNCGFYSLSSTIKDMGIHLPVILTKFPFNDVGKKKSPEIGRMVVIPSHGWFMALFYPHYLISHYIISHLPHYISLVLPTMYIYIYIYIHSHTFLVYVVLLPHYPNLYPTAMAIHL